MALASRVKRSILGAALVVTACAFVPSAASAVTAVSLWSPFRGCPVDNAAMLAVPAGGYGSGCVELVGVDPQFTVGNQKVQDFSASFQERFGVAGASTSDPSLGVVVPSGQPSLPSGDISLLPSSLDPSDILFGAAVLVCNELYYNGFIDAQTWIDCQFGLTGLSGPAYTLTHIHVAMQPAGPPSNFGGPAAVSGTGPVLTVPVKIQLQSSALGKSCYVGSNTNPIVLHIAQTVSPDFSSSQPDPNGFPVTIGGYSNGKYAASGFTEPGATGCGSGGLLDPLVNALLGLPSKGTKGSFTAVGDSNIAWTTAGGSVLSQAYHAALG
jgi:hypothetical protein